MTETIRPAVTADHTSMVQAIQEWWSDSRSPQEARELSLLLPRLFLQHFAGTSLVLEDDGDLVGFLVGFYSADEPEEAYIHFVGVSPTRRRSGAGRLLYERFFEEARRSGRRRVRAVTSPQNTGSLAFHRSMGFQLETDPANQEPTVFEDYDGPGQPRHSLVRRL